MDFIQYNNTSGVFSVSAIQNDLIYYENMIKHNKAKQRYNDYVIVII